MTKSARAKRIGWLLLGVVAFFAGRATVDTEGVEKGREARPDRPGPQASAAAGDRDSAGNDWRSKYGGDPRAATRRVMNQLSLSPMMNMDFDGMFLAWELFRGMSLEELEQALEEIENAKNPQIGMMMKMMIMGRWAALDGQGAMEYAIEQEGMQKMMAVNGALMGWVKNDPQGAYAWYEKNRDKLGGGMMGAGQMDTIFYSSMAQTDLPGTLEKIAVLDSDGKRRAINAVAMQMSMDPAKREEFFDLLEEMGDPKLAKDARTSLIQGWGWQDPKGAAAYLATLSVGDEEKLALEQHLMSSWSNTDPAGAFEWKLGKGGSAEEKRKVIEDNFGNWLQRDEKGASEWLAKQPEEMMTDKLFQSSSERLRWNKNFDRSVAWAEQIVDDGERAKEFKEVYTQWKSVDEEKAGGWLATLDDELQLAVTGEGAVEETVARGDPSVGGGADPAVVREMIEEQIREVGTRAQAGDDSAAEIQALENLLEQLEAQGQEGQ